MADEVVSDSIDPGASVPTVTVCRGCCCGTSYAHPGVDHSGQLARLRGGLEGHGRIRISTCLGPCENGNYVIVAPSAAGRHNGAKPVWLAEILDEGKIDDIVSWVRAGGPGFADVPGTVEVYK